MESWAAEELRFAHLGERRAGWELAQSDTPISPSQPSPLAPQPASYG
jgi:hypothetical protein